MKTSDVLIFATGFVAGGLASWVYLKKKFDERIDAERAVLRDIYIKRSNSTSDSEKAPERAENSLKTHSEGYSRDIFIEKLNELARTDVEDEKRFKDYSSMYGGDDIADEDKEVALQDKFIQINSMQASKENPVEEKLPYILSEDEWDDPSPAYDKITLEYFVEDDILIDSLSHEIMDVSQTVSEANIEYLNESDADYIYVRNDSKGCDYEVIKNYEEYVVSEKGYYGIY